LISGFFGSSTIKNQFPVVYKWHSRLQWSHYIWRHTILKFQKNIMIVKIQ
jgi:hypothetical protein